MDNLNDDVLDDKMVNRSGLIDNSTTEQQINLKHDVDRKEFYVNCNDVVIKQSVRQSILSHLLHFISDTPCLNRDQLVILMQEKLVIYY